MCRGCGLVNRYTVYAHRLPSNEATKVAKKNLYRVIKVKEDNEGTKIV